MNKCVDNLKKLKILMNKILFFDFTHDKFENVNKKYFQVEKEIMEKTFVLLN